MKQNSILIDSGYGSYLKSDVPKAVANEFLYYNPNILLWVDEFYCDSHAMTYEEKDAQEGFLVSELSVALRNHRIIRERDFSTHFTDEVKTALIAESISDLQMSRHKELMPYVIPEIDASAKESRNKFFDINSLLLLSGRLNIPFLNTKPSTNYFYWKFDKWREQYVSAELALEQTKSLISFNHIMDISVPKLTIFPRTRLFTLAEKSKAEMIQTSYAFEQGEINKTALNKSYDKFLKAYLKYDHSVKTEATENFLALLEYRNDKRLIKFRNYIEAFSQRLTNIEPELVQKEAALLFEKEQLEIQFELIDEMKETTLIDKYGAYISFPYSFLLTGLSVATSDPLYAFLMLFTNFITTASQTAKSGINNKYVWRSYLHDMQVNVERTQQLRVLEKKLKKIRK